MQTEQLKVLLLNCSPNKQGCTYTALEHIAQTLQEQGVGSKILFCNSKPVVPCSVCGHCKNSQPARCAYSDQLNVLLEELDDYSGIIIGSPVHYASASGIATSFCDRLFQAAGARLAYKPGAAITSARRAGTTAALDQLNKYFTINNMPIVPSQYWNMVHGSSPNDVKQDAEGLQTMRTLARNMVWMMKCIAAGKQAGIIPQAEEKIRTNFIR